MTNQCPMSQCRMTNAPDALGIGTFGIGYSLVIRNSDRAAPPLPPLQRIFVCAHSGETPMKIHEYQAKELLAAAGAAVPRGIVARSPAEAQQAFDTLGGGPVVLKAQVHAGGRGKGQFKGSGQAFGGVKYLRGRDEVGKVAEVMLKFPLVTKQT